MPNPLCFVLIPSGKIEDVGGVTVDFIALYSELLVPAIEDAGLEPFRVTVDAELGILPSATLESFMLSEVAIADLSATNVTLFYELGVRDALYRRRAVLTYPMGATILHQSTPSELFLYTVSAEGKPVNVEVNRRNLAHRLEEAARSSSESSLLEAMERPPTPRVDHTATDVFRDRVRYSTKWKERLREARDAEDLAALQAAEKELDIAKAESGVLVDLLLSYRALGSWNDMIDIVDKMAAPLARSTMVQEQLALALNRAGRQKDAVRVLESLIERRGPSSETCGLLGRVYKDQWEAAKKSGDEDTEASLEAAIDAYLKGFEADWRDAFPGINAATLMEVQEPPDNRRKQIIPIVVYAAERSVASGERNYWDHAALLEAAVLAKDRGRAESAFQKALACVRESWEPETTARNLRLIREARERRGEIYQWANTIQEELERRAAR